MKLGQARPQAAARSVPSNRARPRAGRLSRFRVPGRSVCSSRLPVDEGSAGIWVLALSGVVLLAGTASVLAGLAIISRHEAGTAADLAALAAASQALSGSEVACSNAAQIAAINGAELQSCDLGGDGVVDVTVTVTLRFGSLGLGVAQADARAGPAETDVPG